MTLRTAIIFLAIAALLCGQFAGASAPVCTWAESQKGPALACESCCSENKCCAVNKQDAPPPAQPLASGGASIGVELLAALTPELTAVLYTFPAMEQQFVVMDTAHRGYVADPLAVSCIRLI